MPKLKFTIFKLANGSKFQKIFTEFPSPNGGNTLWSSFPQILQKP